MTDLRYRSTTFDRTFFAARSVPQRLQPPANRPANS
jgi:hypothetical protein